MSGESIDIGMEKVAKKVMEKKMEKETVKDYLILYLRELAKFALLGIISLFSIGLISTYILIEIFKIDIEIAGLIGGVVTALTIFIVDCKKLHSTEKMHDANFKIIKMIFHKKQHNDITEL